MNGYRGMSAAVNEILKEGRRIIVVQLIGSEQDPGDLRFRSTTFSSLK